MQGVSRYVFHYGEMEQQISDLEEENAQLQQQIRESQEALQENELLRNLLDLRERRRTLSLSPPRSPPGPTTTGVPPSP